MSIISRASVLCALALVLAVSAGALVGTAFTYQGRLEDAGAPANGVYDLEFALYDASTGGSQIGSTVTKDDVSVANGLFVVALDFGGNAFAGDARWLEIGVRSGASTASFTILSGRQELTPVPNAIHATDSANATTVGGLACSEGEVPKWSSGVWSCAVDLDTNSGGTVAEVATGAGLTGGPVTTTGTVAVAPLGITSGMIASGAVGSAQVNPAEVQRRVSGTCPAGQRPQGVNADGSLVCQPAVGTLNGLSGDLDVLAQGNLSVTPSGSSITIATTLPTTETREVDCDTGGSINDTLAELSKAGPNVVTVTGSCQENVLVVGYDDLTLQAGTGGATILPSALPGYVEPEVPVGIEVVASRRVVVQGFSILNGSNFRGIVLNGCSMCTVRENAITNGGGISHLHHGFAMIEDNTISQASLEGIHVFDAGAHLLGNHVEDATGIGVIASGSASIVLDGLTYTGVGWCGVAAWNSATVTIRAQRRGMTSIQGAMIGVLVADSAEVSSHKWTGVPVTLGIPDRTIGISAAGHGDLVLEAVQISNATGTAVSLEDQANAYLSDISITGTGGYALNVVYGARLHARGPTSISGTGGQDVHCDSYSLVRGSGNITGATTIDCPNYLP